MRYQEEGEVMDAPKPGEIVTDGKSVAIGAPLIKVDLRSIQAPPEPTKGQLAGTVVRHLKGILSAAEALQARLEREEKK